jgi:hypothetical protein
MGADDQTDAEPADDRSTAEGIDHLQAAASEMIAAARSFLDAVEGVVHDRDAVASVVDTLSTVAHAASQAASRVRPPRDRPAPGGGTRPDDGDDGSSRVQHIRVS